MRAALIDADFLPYYVCHNKKDEGGNTTEKTFEECKAGADSLLKSIFTLTKATHYILAFTVGKCFRYTVYPEYKANRKYKEVIPYLKETKEYLIENYHSTHHPDLEADDIVRIVYERDAFINDDGTETNFIVSPDKDMLMLEGKHYNPKTNEWIETSEAEANAFFWKSVICGDGADGVKGLMGKGEAFAKKLFSILANDKYYPEAVLSAFISHYNDVHMAIEEYYKNYKCLYILKEYGSYEIPEMKEVSSSSF